MSDRFPVTEEQRKLFGVLDDLATMIEAGQPEPPPENFYYVEELIPPMTEDHDEVITDSKLTGSYLPQGTQMGFTLWRGQKAYRISVSEIPI
jgi:hypothetical protein